MRRVSRTKSWVQAGVSASVFALGNICLQTSWLHSNNREHQEDSSCIDTPAQHPLRIVHMLYRRGLRKDDLGIRPRLLSRIIDQLAMTIALCTFLLCQTPDARVQKLHAEAKSAEAAGDVRSAIAKYQEILKLAPRLGAAYNNLGLLYFKQRDFENAALILRKGLTVDPKMPSASALLGISLYQLGKYSEAKASLEKALSANPEDNNAELFLARALIRLEDHRNAAEHLQKLAQREPDNQEIWYLLGKIYMHLSEQSLARMNAIDPNSVLAHEMSGEIMASMKNYDGAVVEFKKAVEMAPQQAGTHYELANAYWNLGDWDAASAQFQAELANDPHNCMAKWKLGNILLEQNTRPDKALADTDEALSTCPTLIQARVDRARALLKLNRNQDALPDLETAVNASPDEPTIHFFLAQAYRALGRTQEAKLEMQAFAKLEESARAATVDRAQQVIKNQDEISH
jgi:tetratricopeptide (TPR) repeat protein